MIKLDVNLNGYNRDEIADALRDLAFFVEEGFSGGILSVTGDSWNLEGDEDEDENNSDKDEY